MNWWSISSTRCLKGRCPACESQTWISRSRWLFCYCIIIHFNACSYRQIWLNAIGIYTYVSNHPTVSPQPKTWRGELQIHSGDRGEALQFEPFLGADAWIGGGALLMRYVFCYCTMVQTVQWLDYKLWKSNRQVITWSASAILFSFLFHVLWSSWTRKPILELHERFLCGGGWGLERTFNRWVSQQPWRQRLPLKFFEILDSNSFLSVTNVSIDSHK